LWFGIWGCEQKQYNGESVPKHAERGARVQDEWGQRSELCLRGRKGGLDVERIGGNSVFGDGVWGLGFGV
jgi:hypothetical protein